MEYSNIDINNAGEKHIKIKLFLRLPTIWVLCVFAAKNFSSTLLLLIVIAIRAILF